MTKYEPLNQAGGKGQGPRGPSTSVRCCGDTMLVADAAPAAAPAPDADANANACAEGAYFNALGAARKSGKT